MPLPPIGLIRPNGAPPLFGVSGQQPQGSSRSLATKRTRPNRADDDNDDDDDQNNKKKFKRRQRTEQTASTESMPGSGMIPKATAAADPASTPTPTPTQQEHLQELQEFRKSLPVYPYKQKLIQAIVGNSNSNSNNNNNSNSNNKVVLITAETGSGKSTQIPAYVLEYYDASKKNGSNSKIAVTQPRRVAAMTLAQRVAQEQHCGEGRYGKCGGKVGYRVRFDDCTGPATKLVYLTDGMLLREAMVDPFLQQYNFIFLDECHERSLQTDILLGVVQRARQQRQHEPKNYCPLHVVVMSATLQIQIFEHFFGGPENTITISIPGRQYPVELLYTKEPVEEFIDAALSTVLQIHRHEPPGDILVFLPGQEEIEDLGALLRYHLEEEKEQDKEHLWTGDKVVTFSPNKEQALASSSHLVDDVLICLLYASLPPEAQMAAFETKPTGCTRKIVLATTIAETSVTLPDIRYVVDTGKHKCRRQIGNGDGSTGMESLQIEPISQAQAAQRSGRAGRVQAGLCFRLYTQDAFETLEADTVPEILRVSLAQVLLQLKGMGIDDPTTFDFVSPPTKAALLRATKLLYGLRALDKNMQLTEHGKKLAKLPLDPMFGHLLCVSQEHACVQDMLTAVAVLSAENVFYRPSGAAASDKAASMHRRFASYEGDFPTGLNVYQAWQREAVYVPPQLGGRKMQTKVARQQQQQQQQQRPGGTGTATVLSHGEWCRQNYVSGRAMVRAHSIRQQLQTLCERPVEQGGLAMDVHTTCGTKERERFFRAVAAGLFLQAASRIKTRSTTTASTSNGRGGNSGNLVQYQRGQYRTKMGNQNVSIHPSSAIFGRNPAPSCVVYTELVTTKKTYIRGVTQIREQWLHEVAPDFYPK